MLARELIHGAYAVLEAPIRHKMLQASKHATKKVRLKNRIDSSV